MKSQRLMMLAAITCGISFALGLVVITSSSANVSTASRPISPSGAVVIAFDPGVDPNDSQIQITPDQMQLRGDVATRANCAHSTVCSWFDATPAGSIILGVDPTSPYTNTWDGGSATAQLYIGGIVQPTVGALTISWPDRDGKGIHSPLRRQVAAISFDGDVIWDMRTEYQSTFGDYYAAQHEPIRLTFVVTQSLTHTLVITVPPRTAWDISQMTINLSPMPSLIRGIAYSPYRDCQTPHWGTRVPSITEISEDMPRLFHAANAIRTYSSLYPLSEIPRLAYQWGLRVSPARGCSERWTARAIPWQIAMPRRLLDLSALPTRYASSR